MSSGGRPEDEGMDELCEECLGLGVVWCSPPEAWRECEVCHGEGVHPPQE